jgi:hypothetical protein
VAFTAQEHEVPPAKMGFAPIATNDLLQRVQWLATGGFARKLQHQLLGIRPTDYFKPDGPKETAASAKIQLPTSAVT